MFDTLDITCYVVWNYFDNFVRIYAVISAIFFGVFLQSTGASRWWVGCIPVVNVIAKRWSAGIPIILVVLYIWLESVFLIFGGGFVMIVVLFILSTLINFLFARVYLSSNAALYAFVPMAKYILMYKEVEECKSMSKAKTTKKTTTKKISKTSPQRIQKQR